MLTPHLFGIWCIESNISNKICPIPMTEVCLGMIAAFFDMEV